MIKRLLWKLIKWAGSHREDESKMAEDHPRAIRGGLATAGNEVEVQGLNFIVMPAIGGTIVQMRTYDRKTDRSNHITHLIPDGEDISERIGHIVSLEILRST